MAAKLLGESPAIGDDPRCGTITGYKIHVIKRQTDPTHMICEACRRQGTLRQRQYRKDRILNGAVSIPRVPGSRSHFDLVGGELRVDATGTRRRLMALFVMGWNWRELGSRMGVGPAEDPGRILGHIVRLRSEVYPETRDKVVAIYDELSMVPAPVNNYANRARTIGKRQGYVRPLNWDDDQIDDPYGLPSGLTKPQLNAWYFNCAKELERVCWVERHGFGQLYRFDRGLGKPGRPKAAYYL